MRVTHTWTDTTATIAIEGLPAPIRFLHVTDAHCALVDDRDAAHRETCLEYCRRFAGNEAILAQRFQEAREQAVDLLALTGDIIHFPSQAAVEHLAALRATLPLPLLFSSGNHDWRFPDLPGSDPVRDTWRPALQPLHRGDAACAAVELGGVQFLQVDTSTYQVDEEQLTWLTARLATGQPAVLFMHIPLSLPTLRAPVIQRWQAPILVGDPDWNPESRTRWMAGQDRATTLEFVRRVTAAPNVVAVCCGHVHFPHVDAMNPWAAQYVGGLGFEGGRRLVELRPL